MNENEFWKQFIRKDSIVFDVGAYEGCYIKKFLRLEPALVVAVEPQSDKAKALGKEYSGNEQVIVFRCALGEKVGIKQLFKTSYASSISSLRQDWVMGSNRFGNYVIDGVEEVSVVTLDTIIGMVGKPAFIKIDAEGYDHKVLQGLNFTVPALRFEFTREFFSDAIEGVDKIATLGDYEFGYIAGEGIEEIEWCSKDVFFFVLKEKQKIANEWGNIYARLRV